jgi:hypothetical protein
LLPTQRRWVDRHCLRAAVTGLFLPYLNLYSNGPTISVCWSVDNPDEYPSAPGHFLYDGLAQIERRPAMTAIGEFVSKVLSWCEGLADPRIDRLREDWDAITGADEDEQGFCRAAGKLGLDPYVLGDWPSGLVDLLSSGLGIRIDEPVVEDLLESVAPDSMTHAWRWVSNTEQTFDLRAGTVASINAVHRLQRAKDYGYSLAREVRSLAGLPTDAAVESVAKAALQVTGARLSFENHNHLPDKRVLAAVGWRGGSDAVIAGPRPSREDSTRFLESRGLYQLLVGCRNGARLVTQSHTWDQQAARAFAAEFLAPQEALAEDATADMDPDERVELQERLAGRFNVSTEVVRLQLQNQGVWHYMDD